MGIVNFQKYPKIKLVVFVRSQIHSYAYHLVSVRRHNQHVRSPIQGFFRCEGISFIPRVQQRSTFPRLPPQERQNYITSPRPVSTAQGGEFRHIGRRFSPWTTEILIEQGGVMADVTKGIARTAPLNAWNDGKTADLRQSPQPPEQARGV